MKVHAINHMIVMDLSGGLYIYSPLNVQEVLRLFAPCQRGLFSVVVFIM